MDMAYGVPVALGTLTPRRQAPDRVSVGLHLDELDVLADAAVGGEQQHVEAHRGWLPSSGGHHGPAELEDVAHLLRPVVDAELVLARGDELGVGAPDALFEGGMAADL